MKPLPALMVAPNGARLSRADHPALPVNLAQIIDTARACAEAGADGLHLHLRDGDGQHVLDAGLYDEALAELARAVPEMTVQVTTESRGLYDPAFQRSLMLQTRASLVSVALREITADGDMAATRRVFLAARERGIAVQHILYDPTELTALAHLLGPRAISDPRLQLLFVLGGHDGRDGAPGMLTPFLSSMTEAAITPDWMACAFGPAETDCLFAAHRAGGKLRVGFENGFWMRDGRLARDNAERVREIHRLTAQPPQGCAGDTIRSKAG